MTARRLTLGVLTGVAAVAATSVAAWALAHPHTPLSGALVRALTDCAAILTVGLAAVPLLDTARHRVELSRRAARPLTAAAAVWALSEVVRLTVEAAQTAGLGFWQIGVHTVAEFGWFTTAGRAGLVAVAAASVVGVAAAVAAPGGAAAGAVLGVAAVGMAARTLTGHLSESPLGGMAVAVHALAAAVWCGVLAALALTVTHRGQWARVLPRFSQLSLVCVGVLLAGGIVGALIRLHSPTELWATGYGRLLTAKLVVTVGLVVLAWRNRSVWLPAARAHRSSATLSQTRSAVELAVMVVAVTFAAALAVTG